MVGDYRGPISALMQSRMTESSLSRGRIVRAVGEGVSSI